VDRRTPSLSSRPVDLSSEVIHSKPKRRVMSVAADHHNQTSVDYLPRSPPCISANDLTTAWHGMESSRSFNTAALPPGNNMGRCYVNGSLSPPLCKVNTLTLTPRRRYKQPLSIPSSGESPAWHI